jgi:hypothetical protein
MKINEILIKEPDKRIIDTSKRNPKELLNIIKTECSDAFQSFVQDKRALYKGFNGKFPDIWITDPKLSKRKSANTSNYYTLLFSNLPSWRRFPRRDSSLICTTNSMVAGNYSGMFGGLYIIFPVNGSKIGICSHNDMWSQSLIDLNDDGPSDFNEALQQSGLSSNSFNALISSCVQHKAQLIATLGAWKLSLEMIDRLQLCKTSDDFLKFFNLMLSPTRNNFHLTTIKNIVKIPTNRECWTDGKSYLVKDNSKLADSLRTI